MLLCLMSLFGGLSVSEIEKLSSYITTLNKEEGITFVIIEHRLREFMKVVDRVIALNYGRTYCRRNTN